MIRTRTGSAVRAILAFTVLTVASFVTTDSSVSAQSWGGGVFSLGTVESIFGPLLPPCGIGNTFRSEISTGIAAVLLDKALLSGPSGKFDLIAKDAPNQLDEHPTRYDVNLNVRLWRFGFRGTYLNFESRQIDRFDFSGMVLGGDFDVVKWDWLALGAAVDFYFIDPTFRGLAFTTTLLPPPQTYPIVDLKGDRPIQWGGYMRYIPPEILGWPMHFEAFLKVPYKKNPGLTSFGASLVFRPQIYRFDVAAKLSIEKYYFKFKNVAEVQSFPSGVLVGSQDWEMNMNWKAFCFDVAIYF